MSGNKIAVFIPDLTGGGGERMMLRLAGALAERGMEVDLVLMRKAGAYLPLVPRNVRCVSFERRRMLAALGPLAAYLREARPRAVLSTLVQANLAVLLARRLARTDTRILLVSESVSTQFRRAPQLTIRLAHRFLIRRLFPRADRIVVTTRAMGAELAETYALPTERIRLIPNPVLAPEILDRAAGRPDHAWFKTGQPPVVLGVGRLEPAKDFPTLLRAFAHARRQIEARLLILGEGSGLAELSRLARDLGIEEDVSMPGFALNPYPYMAACGVFVLSSIWEGLPTALIEALYCGAPVVSTSCHSGPAEILEDGRHGRLVTPGDYRALGEAILETLRSTGPGGDRAFLEQYQVSTVVDQYMEELQAL